MCNGPAVFPVIRRFHIGVVGVDEEYNSVGTWFAATVVCTSRQHGKMSEVFAFAVRLEFDPITAAVRLWVAICVEGATLVRHVHITSFQIVVHTWLRLPRRHQSDSTLNSLFNLETSKLIGFKLIDRADHVTILWR